MSVKFHASFLKILTGSDLSQRRIPYMRATADKSGPSVWLTACCHGDEVGGIVVVQEVFKRLAKKVPLLEGIVHAFPLMNPLGFENASRQITMSNEDLNRAFPGDTNGTLAERLACKIFDSITDTRPAVVIDLHNDWIRSIPYVVVDALESASPMGPVIREMAIQTGLPVVEETSPLKHTLSHSLLQSHVPALTLELGESFVVNEGNVDIGVRSVMNIMAKLNMTSLAPADESEQPVASTDIDETKILKYCQTPASSTSGIVRFLVREGDRIQANQPVAKIVNAFGRQRELIRAPESGVVLAISDSSVAFPGAPIMALGVG